MTYGEVRDASLQLINQYSIAGTKIPESYNNQRDYLNRIPFLVNDAQMYAATHGRRIPATVSLGDLGRTVIGKYVRYQMPGDFYQFKSLSVLTYAGETRRLPFVRTEPPKSFLLPDSVSPDSETVVEYYRFPAPVFTPPFDGQLLDNTPDVQQILPYYVAAHLVLADDAYLQATLYNEFETRLSRVSDPATVEQSPIEDCYGFSYEPDIWR